MYSGSSIIKYDFLFLYPVNLFINNAQKKIITIPAKYIKGPTHDELLKNAPANNAITGSFAPHGINGASIAVALLSLSSRIVLQAITPGIAQPVPITNGITDLPDKPTFLNIGSRTTDTLAMYPQSSSKAIKKYITITSGKNPITAITPPMIPSTRIEPQILSSPSTDTRPATHSWNNSSQPVNKSAIHTPGPTCEIQNTRNITTAKIGIPNHLLVNTSSILSWKFLSFVNTFLFSTFLTMSLTNANLFLSAFSTSSFVAFVKSS